MRVPTQALLLVAALAVAGCVVGPQNPYPPIPPSRVEVVPKPPVSEDPLLWQPGHWDFLGGSYAWAAGRWVPRGGHGVNWQDGYWTSNPDGRWVWIPAHWI
jgi:hypothetical protein